MTGQVRIRASFQEYATKWFDYLMVSKPEMEEILKGTDRRAEEYLESDVADYIAFIGKTTST